ncbi:hypothetical protein C2845_PM01G44070 [Panicum miliaceum]|uniref:Uncharacterized protein n=1 Tax=Panicum miliaceum TaxID=4540 RepID=A0A3L6TN77_PANMI|nr:hypothetical protein C2845_PM01G44070 [Panicum miliaceum]
MAGCALGPAPRWLRGSVVWGRTAAAATRVPGPVAAPPPPLSERRGVGGAVPVPPCHSGGRGPVAAAAARGSGPVSVPPPLGCRGPWHGRAAAVTLWRSGGCSVAAAPAYPGLYRCRPATRVSGGPFALGGVPSDVVPLLPLRGAGVCGRCRSWVVRGLRRLRVCVSSSCGLAAGLRPGMSTSCHPSGRPPVNILSVGFPLLWQHLSASSSWEGIGWRRKS